MTIISNFPEWKPTWIARGLLYEMGTPDINAGCAWVWASVRKPRQQCITICQRSGNAILFAAHDLHSSGRILRDPDRCAGDGQISLDRLNRNWLDVIGIRAGATLEGYTLVAWNED